MISSKAIVFSGNFLIKDDQKVTIEDFSNIIPEGLTAEYSDNEVHTFLFEYDEHFLKIKFATGSSLPRNPEVINITTKKPEPNPRNINQIEPQEHFALIDFNQGFFWISNSRKRKMVIDFLKTRFLNSELIIKDVYNEKLFIESIQKLDELRFTATPDLFSDIDVLSKALKDEINLFEAVEAVLSLKFKNRFVGNNILDRFKSTFKNRNSFKNIMISGRDKNDLGLLFNSNVFSKKIEFRANVDDNEMFDSREVFRSLIGKIKDEVYQNN